MRPLSAVSQSWIIALVLSAGWTWLAFIAVDRPLVGIDDANIFLTYAKNVSNGHGFVYFAGGEPVEGFTSLLWVLVCAICYHVTGSPETLLLAINVGLLAVTTHCAAALAEAILANSPGADLWTPTSRVWFVRGLVWSWVFTCPKYVIWTTVTLMDTGAWAAIFIWGSSRFVLPQLPSWRTVTLRCVAVTLMLLIRPEGMMIAVTWIVVAAWTSDSHGRGRLSRFRSSSIWAPIATYCLVICGLTLFRVSYFGYPLPNTFYAKVSPSLFYNVRLGLGYLKGYLIAQPLAAAAMLFAVLTLLASIRDRKSISRQARTSLHVAAAMILVAAASIPVLTGGDHFGYYRFYQPMWPFLGAFLSPIVARFLMGRLAQPRFRHLLTTGFAITVFLAQTPRWYQIDSEIRVEFDYAVNGRLIGEQLNALLIGGADLRLGVGAAGGVAYTYEGPLLDLMGLNSVPMGHSPGDRRGNKNHAAFHIPTFYDLRPDLVRPELVREPQPIPRVKSDLLPDRDGFWDTAMRGIMYTDRFQREYVPLWVRAKSTGSLPADRPVKGIKVWCRRETYDQLKGQGVDMIRLPDD